MTVSINGSGAITFNDASTQSTAATGFGFKNRIINGAMVIDQRNAGASVTSGFAVDRFSNYLSYTSNLTYQQNAGGVTPPLGFTNYLGVTTGTARTVGSSDVGILFQAVEGNNVSDLGWGTSNAQTVTLSFWARSSLTGTHSGSLINNGDSRSYVFQFQINAANTWEYRTVIIAGDTSGTWLTNNGKGISVSFNLGTGPTFLTTAGSWNSGGRYGATGSVQLCATTGATFYITGVQLEKGSTATSFDYRPYGTELALCQRYYYTATASTMGCLSASKTFYGYWALPVSMRAKPSVAQSGTVTVYGVNYADFNTSAPALNGDFGVNGGVVNFGGASTAGGSVGLGAWVYGTGILQFSSEL